MSIPKYSLVIPVYNSEDTLEELYRRIDLFYKNAGKTYEIIFVDDCSHDSSWKILNELFANNSTVKIIHLSKNFGQHNATLCGFNYSKGDYVITMDDDLQHPPEEMEKLINTIEGSYSVVYGAFYQKKNGTLTNVLSKIFQKFIHRILSLPPDLYISSFAIYDRNIVNNICKKKSSQPFLPGLVANTTHQSKITNVGLEHNEREFGKSNYNLYKYFKYSLNLIVNYSSLPLTILGIFGILISLFSFVYGTSIILQKIMNPDYGLMGWNSLMVATTFLSGTILMGVSIIGEYLKRILAELSYGTQYIVEESHL